MKNYIFLLIAIVLVSIIIIVPTCRVHQLNELQVRVNEFQTRIDNVEKQAVDAVTHTLITNPGHFFPALDYSSEWEEIDAIPYSKCYCHLIGTSTVADYIICKAI